MARAWFSKGLIWLAAGTRSTWTGAATTATTRRVGRGDGDGCSSDPHEPELQPPPLLTGLVEVMEKPERCPASMKSTLIAPHVSSKVWSTRKVNLSSSKTLSFSFDSSRAKPRDGPDQPPCIKAIRTADSILFCERYDFRFSTAVLVTSNMTSSIVE